MDDYLVLLAENERTIFKTIADYAFLLGYRAKKDKTAALGYSFTHSKIKKPVLRFTSSRGKPILRLKFFASPVYSEYFQEAIKATIEEYDYRYTGCFGCGRCDSTQGYTYRYPDGREYYRCGSELIEFYNLEKAPVGELLKLFKQQHDYYLALS